MQPLNIQPIPPLKEGLVDVQWLLNTPEISHLLCPIRIEGQDEKPSLQQIFKKQIAWNMPIGHEKITRASMLPLLAHLDIPLETRRGWCKATDVDNDGHVTLKELVVFVGFLVDGWKDRVEQVALRLPLELQQTWLDYAYRFRLGIIFECFTYGKSASGAIMTTDMWEEVCMEQDLPTFDHLWPNTKWIDKKSFINVLMREKILLEDVASVDIVKLFSFKRPHVLYLRAATTVRLERASATRLGARLRGMSYVDQDREEDDDVKIAAATMSTSFASLVKEFEQPSQTLAIPHLPTLAPLGEVDQPGSGPMPNLNVDGPAPNQFRIPRPPEDMIAPITDDYKLRLGQLASLLRPVSPHQRTDQFSDFSLDVETVLDICDKVEEIFSLEQTVLEATGHTIVYGDLHGQFIDFLQFCHSIAYPLDFMPNGNIRSCNYVFLGDYVDRGTQSLEIVCLLFLLKICYPDKVFLIRGNHEDRNINGDYGFLSECHARLRNGRRVWERINQVFDWLPLACIVEKSILCVHGGIGSINNVDQIAKIPRGPGQPHCAELVDVLWSDPSDDYGLHPNDVRGTSYYYGPDIVKKFLSRNGLSLLVRAHEVQAHGWTTHANGQCLTVFSATNYCGSYRNDGAVLEIFPNDTKYTREVLLQFKILGSGMLQSTPKTLTVPTMEAPQLNAVVSSVEKMQLEQDTVVTHEAVGGWLDEQRPPSPIRPRDGEIQAPWY